ncbi:uncharacterized protein LOC123193118 [Mangifera indica]|uniref:uncharacterized protein LOC123193118 n=1 Tax=Mangifera indica TaxID=29780 RepID=UPI001CF9B357|nr:uncharacterized protein LOC123193118 [Mangifera indica]
MDDTINSLDNIYWETQPKGMLKGNGVEVMIHDEIRRQQNPLRDTPDRCDEMGTVLTENFESNEEEYSGYNDWDNEGDDIGDDGSGSDNGGDEECDDVGDDNDENSGDNKGGHEAGVGPSGLAKESLLHNTPTMHGQPIPINVQVTNPFFGGPDPYRDVENEGIALHSIPPRDRRIKVNDQFTSKQVLIDTMYRDALEKGYQIKVANSNKKRWDIKCAHVQCKWKASGVKLQNTDIFVLRKLETHTCPRDIIMSHHRQIGKRTLGKILQYMFTASNRIYRLKDIITNVADRYKIDISYTQAWRAKNWALNEIRSSPEESFRQLPIYCYNLEQKNSGIVTHIDTNMDNRFHFVFMALGCSIRAFQEYCRPDICIDGSFLKG